MRSAMTHQRPSEERGHDREARAALTQADRQHGRHEAEGEHAAQTGDYHRLGGRDLHADAAGAPQRGGKDDQDRTGTPLRMLGQRRARAGSHRAAQHSRGTIVITTIQECQS